MKKPPQQTQKGKYCWAQAHFVISRKYIVENKANRVVAALIRMYKYFHFLLGRLYLQKHLKKIGHQITDDSQSEA